jgi:hypothetical protein
MIKRRTRFGAAVRMCSEQANHLPSTSLANTAKADRAWGILWADKETKRREYGRRPLRILCLIQARIQLLSLF